MVVVPVPAAPAQRLLSRSGEQQIAVAPQGVRPILADLEPACSLYAVADAAKPAGERFN